ncbi:MAG: GTPase Era [Bacteroidetes bacterium]|jgi:GTP-binding protein Era|nr:GTPase Era [Bacteroidota bacterium]MBK8328768.1 GTPase Era [Bacteroidota bacterium]MBK9481651.1 GTPase Era [Bacteroidota bacterium]
MNDFKSGFVGIFGRPNAGKSTLLNGILNEKLAIVSPKAQTTRNRILGILTEKNYQIVFSDTPGILKSNYKLHERMLKEIDQVKQGTDVILFIMDVKDSIEENIDLVKQFSSKHPILMIINKIDQGNQDKIKQIKEACLKIDKIKSVVEISALNKTNIDTLLHEIVTYLPAMPPYYDADTLTDKPMRFFVAELIREKLFFLLNEELPYHAAVIVRQYEEKNTLTKIVADIVVSRETQKAIIIGKNGSMIKEIGQKSREDIEKFIDRKVFLELHVKVRKDWRNNDLYLKEYGY